MRNVLALVIMFIAPLLLWWVPVADGIVAFAAGAAGGYLVGTPRRSLQLALLPVVLLTLLALVLGLTIGFGTGLPIVGAALAGMAVVWLVATFFFLLLGALAGGVIAALVQ